MRGQWFIDGTWQPLEEEESNLIEQEHLSCFRGQQMQENFDVEVSKPLDGKDGKMTNLICSVEVSNLTVVGKFGNSNLGGVRIY